MKFDVIVIGSGPGGYVAAIRASQLGFRTAIVEKYNSLGGTCLNVGCIPSKALLDSSEHYHNARERIFHHGITAEKLTLDMAKMISRKNEVVNQNVTGINYLMQKNQIEVVYGMASFESPNVLLVRDKTENEKRLEAEYMIIATGSKPIVPDSFQYDKERVITSTEALNLDHVPAKMVIVGAGVIGLELGSVFGRLGTKIEVVEYMDSILPGTDKDCSKELMKCLQKLGLKFHLQHMVKSVRKSGETLQVEIQIRDSDESFSLDTEYCLVAIGRKPFTEGLALEQIGIQTDDKGHIIVDRHLHTGVGSIYAIGDVIGGAMLAHKAEDEGVFVAESISGQKPHIDYNLVPSVVYTWPELAAVGKTEEQLKALGVEYKKGKFPFKALGRSRASMDTEGLVKILADQKTDEVLGVHILGARAADLIAEAAALMEFKASAEDIARICHPHPTYSEALREAALAATAKRAIHL